MWCQYNNNKVNDGCCNDSAMQCKEMMIDSKLQIISEGKDHKGSQTKKIEEREEGCIVCVLVKTL